MNLIEAFALEVRKMLVAAPPPSRPTAKAEVPPAAEVEEPERLRKGKRTAKRCPPPAQTQQTIYRTLDQARQEIKDELRTYMAIPDPGHMLLLRAKAGTGKTTALVDLAHSVAEESGERVLYSGGRHDFFDDILGASRQTNHAAQEWQEWLARQWNMEDPELNTCRYAETIAQFNNKGYPSDHFCNRACGRTYMNEQCRYLRQAKTGNKLIFIQHQHIVSGHPLAGKAKLLIGDENPMNVFINEITIPASAMQWADLVNYEDPLAEVLHHLEQLAADGAKLSGKRLYEMLGIQTVIDACVEYINSDRPKIVVPKLDRIKSMGPQVERLPYNVLPVLVPLLLREAYAATELGEFNERVYIEKGELTLLSRNEIADSMPKHIIWADATGDPMLYKTQFRREVKVIEPNLAMEAKIYQVMDRMNGKTSLIRKTENDDPEERAEHEISYTEQAQQLLTCFDTLIERKGYENPAVIVPKALRDYVQANSHFYANRGTNSLQECDVIMIGGTPMAPRQSLERTAKSLFYEVMEKFDTEWLVEDRTYNYVDPSDGQGWAIPVGHYADARLDALLWQTREAELIQSAHRARILFKDTPVYLFTALPIAELPPTKLVTMREVMEAPEGVPVFSWGRVVEFARLTDEALGRVTVEDMMEGLDVGRNTAAKYIDLLLETGDWVLAITQKKGRGRPPKAMTRTPRGESDDHAE